MNKNNIEYNILWFLIYPIEYNIILNDIDVFWVWLNFLELEKFWYKIILRWKWNIWKFKMLTKFCYRKWVIDDLNDRNFVISFLDDWIKVENDWLWSIPIFYNSSKKIVSTLCLKTLINNDDFEYDLDWCNCYFNAWYSLFWSTCLKNIKFLRWNSEIIITNKNFEIIEKDENLNEELGNLHTLWDEVINLIKDYLYCIEKSSDGLVIPTSWWRDSRLLNSLISDKKNIYSYSYWISKNSKKSFETVYARELSNRIWTKFNIITLDEYFNENYFVDWFKLFWISTHLHWMYHIEFYKKILSSLWQKSNIVILSWIVGDLWAWKVDVWNIKTFYDLWKLYYSHWMCINKEIIDVAYYKKYASSFFWKYSSLFGNEKIRIIYLVRIKLILLSYLMIIPEYLWFRSESPFLNKNIVLNILSLSSNERKWRLWQKRYFDKNNLLFEKENIPVDISNSLDQIALNKNKDKLIIYDIEFINKNFIKKVNDALKDKSMENKFYNILVKILWERITLYLKFWLNKFFGIRWLFNKNLDALCYFRILKIFNYLVEFKWKIK